MTPFPDLSVWLPPLSLELATHPPLSLSPCSHFPQNTSHLAVISQAAQSSHRPLCPPGPPALVSP